MFKIMIVEDEIKLREELKLFLENNGYEVILLTEFNYSISFINKNKVDLILMDINLPNVNGQYLCKEIRKNSDIPIIMVTSRNTDIDEIISINYGADDFITKPYNIQVLLARIERLLKRNNESKSIISYNGLNLDISKSIIYSESDKVDLSRNELKIMYYLLKNKGSIVSRDEIINYLWDDGEYIDDNTLTVNINRLRSKLSKLLYKEIIETRRGQGYIIL